MKIFCISDLHSEQYTDINDLMVNLDLPPADVLILAGDIGQTRFGKDRNNYSEVLSRFRKMYETVILIPGNHEYYCALSPDVESRKKVLEDLRMLCEENKVIFLDKSSVVIDGVQFIGTTLWSAIDETASGLMNDFRFVFSNRLDYVCEFADCYRYLKEELISGPEISEQIVITHHLPTDLAIHKRFWNHPVNSGFYTNILDTLNLEKVRYWFCGHTHEYAKVKIEETQVIVNPYGYKGERRLTKTSSEVFDLTSG